MADFNMKPMVDPTAIAALAQRQAQMRAEQAQQEQDNKMKSIEDVAKLTSVMVSTSVEASKARQRKDFITSLSNSAAGLVPAIKTPVQGPVQEGQAPLAPMTAPDVNRQNAVRSAVHLAPDTFAKELAESMFPGGSGQGGGFGGLVPVVNVKTNERSFLQPAKDGTLRLVNGQPLSADWQREYAPTIMQDANTGINTMYQKFPGAQPQALPSGSNVTPAPVSPTSDNKTMPDTGRRYADRSLKEKGQIKEVVAQLKSDPLLVSSERALETMGHFESILNQDFAAAKGPLQGLANRILNKEVGTSTEGDIGRASGGQDVETRFRQFLRTAADGRLTDQNFAEFKTLAGMIKERSSQTYEDTQSMNLEALMLEYDISEREAKILLKQRAANRVIRAQPAKPVSPVDRPVRSPAVDAAENTDTSILLQQALKRIQELTAKQGQP